MSHSHKKKVLEDILADPRLEESMIFLICVHRHCLYYPVSRVPIALFFYRKIKEHREVSLTS